MFNDGKSLFGIHCNDQRHKNRNLTVELIVNIKNNTRKRKLEEPLEIIQMKRTRDN